MLLIPDHIWGILTVWQEARGELHEGRVAVAEVILQRTKQKYASDGTVGGTCLRAFQFSGWDTLDPNRVKSEKLDDDDPIVADCCKAWDEATANVTAGETITKGAMLYYNPAIPAPKWVSNATLTVKIGHHNFYTPNS